MRVLNMIRKDIKVALGRSRELRQEAELLVKTIGSVHQRKQLGEVLPLTKNSNDES